MGTRNLGEHTDNVTCLAATQKYLVSGSEDKTVKVPTKLINKKERGGILEEKNQKVELTTHLENFAP